MRLCPASLTCEELDVALVALHGGILVNIPEAYAPLYSCSDMKDLVAAMPAFNELGLMSPERPNSPVPVSSGDNGGEEDSEETEDDDLEEVSPPSQSELLRNLADDDDIDELLDVDSPRPTGVLTRLGSIPWTP